MQTLSRTTQHFAPLIQEGKTHHFHVSYIIFTCACSWSSPASEHIKSHHESHHIHFSIKIPPYSIPPYQSNSFQKSRLFHKIFTPVSSPLKRVGRFISQNPSRGCTRNVLSAGKRYSQLTVLNYPDKNPAPSKIYFNPPPLLPLKSNCTVL